MSKRTAARLKETDPLAIPDVLKMDAATRRRAWPQAVEEPEAWEIEAAEPLKLEGLRWVRTYFYGVNVKDMSSSVGWLEGGSSPPPTCGHSGVYIIPGDKLSTIFCPYSFRSMTVPNDCIEIKVAEDMPFEGEYHRALLRRIFDRTAREGSYGLLDVAALVMTRLGMPVPAVVRPEADPHVTSTGEPRKPKSNGKPIVEEALKALKPTGKRATVARYFLKDVPVSIRAAMAELELTRSGVLSHLFCINRDHGLGYELANDQARLVAPDGFKVWAEEGVMKNAAPKKTPTFREGDYELTRVGDSWHTVKDGKVVGKHPSMQLARTWCKREAERAEKPEAKKPIKTTSDNLDRQARAKKKPKKKGKR